MSIHKMATERFAGVTKVYNKIGEENTPCMLIVPDDIAKKITILADKLQALYNLAYTTTQVTQDQYTQYSQEAIVKANQEILPLLQEANQAGQVFVFSVSGSQYIQPYDITSIEIRGVIIEIRAGTKRQIDLRAICADFMVSDVTLACQRLLNEWGLQYELNGDEDALMMVIGKAPGLMAVKVTPEGYNQWNEIVRGYELPITFTLIAPNGDYYYLYNYRDIIFMGTPSFPGIELLYERNIPAPCSVDYDIAEGLDENDQLIIADIPNWLYDVFRAQAANNRYGGKKLNQLQTLAKSRGLPITGTKEDLIQRLAQRETNDMMATLARRTFT